MPDLHHSWLRAWRGIGARDDGDDLYRALLARYGEPHRKYHTLQHLQECLGHFEAAQGVLPAGAEVEAALWFHDAIYDVKHSGNEERSAEIAVGAMRQAGLAPERGERVRALILATRHDALPSTPDAALLVDIDLGILAADEARFDEYERQVREEYRFVPGFLFRRTRRRILEGFLARERIYTSGCFDADEPSARANLRRSIAQL